MTATNTSQLKETQECVAYTAENVRAGFRQGWIQVLSDNIRTIQPVSCSVGPVSGQFSCRGGGESSRTSRLQLRKIGLPTQSQKRVRPEPPLPIPDADTGAEKMERS